MAIKLDTSTDGGGTTGTSLTWSHTCSGSNRILFVATRGGGGESDRIVGLTYNGQAFTKVGTATEPGDSQVVNLWYMLNPPTGAHNIVITISPSGFISACAASYNGVRQVSQPDNSSTTTASNSAGITSSITTNKNGCWCVMATSQRVTVTAGTNTVKRQPILFDNNSPVSPAATLLMTVGGGDAGTDWATVIASFSPVVSKAALLLNLA